MTTGQQAPAATSDAYVPHVMRWGGPSASPGGELAGPAFPLLMRATAGLCFAGTVLWFLGLWVQGQLGPATMRWGMNDTVITSLTLLVLMGFVVAHMQISETRVSRERLQQSWLWAKEVRVSELADLRLIHLSGPVGWLIAPRAYCRTIGGRNIVLHAADPKVIAAMAELQQFLRAVANPAAGRTAR